MTAFAHVTSAKKIAKYARKMTRDALKDRFSDLTTLIKPKPKYLPMFVWKALLARLLNLNLYRERVDGA